MQSLTLTSPLFSVREKRLFLGSEFPWEVLSYQKDFAAAKGDAFFDLSTWGIFSITGADAQDYLHRMSTVNFKTWVNPDEILHGAFLTGRGGVVSLGFFKKSPQGFLILAPPSQRDRLLEHLEKFHFAEQFTAAPVLDRVLLGIWSSRNPFGAPKALLCQKVVWEQLEIETWQDDSRERLHWVMVEKNQVESLLKKLVEKEFRLIGHHLFEYFRIQAGVPLVGREVSEKDIILETNFDCAVVRNKGCYPGQEVVERIFTYGQVNRKLLPVRLHASRWPDVPIDLLVDGQAVGTLMSYEPDPQDPSHAVGLAYLSKHHWQATEFAL